MGCHGLVDDGDTAGDNTGLVQCLGADRVLEITPWKQPGDGLGVGLAVVRPQELQEPI
jgi:hypothetical protein